MRPASTVVVLLLTCVPAVLCEAPSAQGAPSPQGAVSPQGAASPQGGVSTEFAVPAQGVDGFGPWRFGMSRYEVRSFGEYGPYVAVRTTGGLETWNAEFEERTTNVSFVFGDRGLERIQIWAYEGRAFAEVSEALHRVVRHMERRFGGLRLDEEKLPAGLSREEIVERLPQRFRGDVAAVPMSVVQRIGQRARIAELRVEPLTMPPGAEVFATLRRSDDLGIVWVFLHYLDVAGVGTGGERGGVAGEAGGERGGVAGEAGGARGRAAGEAGGAGGGAAGEARGARGDEAGGPAGGAGPGDAVVRAAPGEPEVLEDGAAIQARLLTAAAYEQRSGDSALLHERPELRDDASARFLLLRLEDQAAVMALVGSFDDGFVLHALPPSVESPVALPFVRDGERHAVTADFQARERVDGRVATYPVRLQVLLDAAWGPDVAVVRHQTLRRGVATLGDRELEFGLVGDWGRHDRWTDLLLFDLDGDGELDRSAISAERFRVFDEFFNFGGASWEFRVDRRGDELTLERLPEKRPDRPALEVGTPAPDFAFVDLDGVERRLSDYRGKVVLLDFWGAWCAPCHEQAPFLVEAHERFHDRGFEIIGIDFEDAEEAERRFLDQFGVTWPQTRESRRGRPIHDLYRVHAWPTHYLVDEEGSILAFDPRSEDLGEILRRHFEEDGAG